MRVLTIANHKGGVGKTVTARALGAILSGDRRVLLIDLDPQSSLTRACGVRDAKGASMAQVLAGTAALGSILQEISPNLWLAPADIALASVELQLTSKLGRERQLSKALGNLPGFDLAICDCPPSLSLLTVNGLVAAHGLLVPTQPELLGLHALALFWDTLEEVRTELNPGLSIMGVVATFCDTRTIHHRDALQVIRDAGYPLLNSTVGRSIRVAESAIVGQSITEYAPQNPRAQEYEALAEEVAEWLASQPG